MENSSPRFSLNSADFYKVARGLVVVLIGASLTYALDTVPHIDFGTYSPIAVSVTTSLVELGRRYLTSYAGQ